MTGASDDSGLAGPAPDVILDDVKPSRWRTAGVEALRLLKTRTFVAMSWTALGLGGSQIIRFAGTLVMTRLLAPEMFGAMSIVIALYVTVALLSDIGLRVAIIQSPRGDDPDFLNTAWTLQIIRAAGIAALVAAFGGLISLLNAHQWLPSGSVWTTPELPLIFAAFAITPLLNGFESTNLITANRNLQMKRVVIIQLVSQMGGFATMIVLGLLTKSIWALVAYNIMVGFLLTVLSHTSLPGLRNRIYWSRGAFTDLVHFGSWILLSSTTFVLAANVDKFYLGTMADAATLGMYSLALNLILLVESVGLSLIGTVALPALSEAARDTPDTFRQKYFRFRLPLDIVLIGASGGLFVLGPTVIQIMYDDRYLAAGGMLQILALSLFFTRLNFAGTVYTALGKPNLWAMLNGIKLVSLIVLLCSLYSAFGFTGAMYAVALHMVAVVPFIYWFNRDLKLNSLKFEMLVLLAWPAGYAAGLAVLHGLKALGLEGI